MGCDIHICLEEKVGECWIMHPNCPRPHRDYDLFALIANVRNKTGLVPYSHPRGLPPDISSGAREYFNSMKADAHSASWLTVLEFKEAVSKHPYAKAILGPFEWVEHEDRLVFWFDN